MTYKAQFNERYVRIKTIVSLCPPLIVGVVFFERNTTFREVYYYYAINKKLTAALLYVNRTERISKPF